MADQKVNIKVTAQGAKKAKNELGGVTGSIKKMGSAVIATSAAYFGTRGIISAFSSVIELAGIQEQAEKKLETALGRTSQALLNQASALQKVTIFGDEATIQQQAFLASIGFTEEKIMSIIPVAMDLATATGMTLESAVRNTAKTFSGLAGELGELVPQLRDLTAEEMKAGEAVKVMAELFGGQATANADTLSGSLQQTENNIGDLGEAIGKRLSPFMKSLSDVTSDYISDLTELIEITGKTDSATLKYFDAVEKGEAVLKKWSEELDITVDSSKSLKDQLIELGVEAKLLRGEKLLPAIGGIWDDEATAMTKASDAVKELVIALEKYKETALPLAERPLTIVSSAEAELLDDVIINMDEMNELMKESFKVNKKNTEQTEEAGYSWEIFNENLDKAVASSVSTASSISSTSDALGSAGEAAKEASISFISAEIQKAVSSYISLFMTTTPLPPFVSAPLALAGGSAFGSLMSSAIQRNFAEGGIVEGNPSEGDSVPAMLTPGEVILNQAQQENLTGGMGGITINIHGGIVDESYVANELIPAINKSTALGNKINA